MYKHVTLTNLSNIYFTHVAHNSCNAISNLRIERFWVSILRIQSYYYNLPHAIKASQTSITAVDKV